MTYYIIWDKNGRIDILRNKEQAEGALKEANQTTKNEDMRDFRYDPAEIWEEDSDEVYQYSSPNVDAYTYCTRIRMDNGVGKLYFLKIEEEKTRGSYGTTIYLFVAPSFQGIMETLKIHFTEEHNRDEECSDCVTDDAEGKEVEDFKCWKALVQEIEQGFTKAAQQSAGIGHTYINGSDYYLDVEVFSIHI